MKKLKFLLPLSLSLIACTDCATRPRPDPTPARKPSGAARVVAIGDVHGDLDSFKKILQRADLTDQDSNWIAGRAVLVQTGDLLDRGKDIRSLLDLVIKLQKQAAAQGGKVIAVMGNHEAMHLAGDFNYVGLKAYAAFVDQDSQSRSDRAFADWAKSAGQDTGPENRKRWMNLHPLGSLEYQEAFGPAGRYGKWLRTLPVIAQVQDTVFLHGGICPEYTFDLDQLNKQVRQQIVQLTQGKPGQSWKSLGGVLFDRSGPLWFRGVALWEESRLSYLTSWLGNRRLVAGHTPNPKGEIQSRLSGRVWLIDTGMASEFFPGGQASALEFDQGKITAIYLDRDQILSRPLDSPPASRLSPEPTAYSGQPAIEGSLTRDEVQAVVRASILQISKCRQQVLKPCPSLASKVVVDFTIDSEGKVANARVSMTSLSDLQVENCMLQKISGWTFPPPEEGTVKVSYPFVFMMH